MDAASFLTSRTAQEQLPTFAENKQRCLPEERLHAARVLDMLSEPVSGIRDILGSPSMAISVDSGRAGEHSTTEAGQRSDASASKWPPP